MSAGSPLVRMFSQLSLLLEKVLVLVVSIPKALVAYVRDWLHFRELANRFPGPPTLPLVGNLFDCGLFPDPWIFIKWVLEDVMYRYPAGQIMMGPVRLIVLSDVNDVQTFLTNSKNQSKPKLAERCLAYTMGRGLITLSGDEWSQHHKLVKPSFHQKLLKTYVPVFNKKSDVFVEHLAEYANGCAFDVKFMIEDLEYAIAIETLFGVPTNDNLTNPEKDLFELMLEGQKEFARRIRSPWLYIEAFYSLTSEGRKAKALLKRAYERVDEFVKERKELLQADDRSSRMKRIVKEDTQTFPSTTETDADTNKKQYNIIIDALLQENGKSLSYQSVLEELLFFFLSSFDTTATTLQFAFHYLAKNPVVQEKAMRELQDIFDAGGSTEVTLDTLQRMQYVEMIVKETLRMHPPIFFTIKEAGVDTPLLSCDLVVPAGAKVIVSPRTVHMDPKLYPDPHVFDPERFSPENCAKRHPFAFFPFSGGLRGCLGKRFAILALKTAISKVIWNYRIEPDESYEPQLVWGISTVTQNGMRVKLTKRTTVRKIN